MRPGLEGCTRVRRRTCRVMHCTPPSAEMLMCVANALRPHRSRPDDSGASHGLPGSTPGGSGKFIWCRHAACPGHVKADDGKIISKKTLQLDWVTGEPGVQRSQPPRRWVLTTCAMLLRRKIKRMAETSHSHAICCGRDDLLGSFIHNDLRQWRHATAMARRLLGCGTRRPVLQKKSMRATSLIEQAVRLCGLPRIRQGSHRKPKRSHGKSTTTSTCSRCYLLSSCAGSAAVRAFASRGAVVSP